MIAVAIGDIHGMHAKLDHLPDEIHAFSTRECWIERPKLVFLGDYVDRGPDATSAMRRLRALQDDSAVCLRGNHEELMARCEDRPIDWQNFILNAASQTLASYEAHNEEFEDDRRWMSSLPTSYEDELRIFVHAGIIPSHELSDQTNHTKMWVRGEFLDFPGEFPKYVVHGHTPTAPFSLLQGSPELRESRCDLDTGACFGEALTAAFFNDAEAKPFHTVSVT
jgi:serine/threonine protein phosphatase 1